VASQAREQHKREIGITPFDCPVIRRAAGRSASRKAILRGGAANTCRVGRATRTAASLTITPGGHRRTSELKQRGLLVVVGDLLVPVAGSRSVPTSAGHLDTGRHLSRSAVRNGRIVTLGRCVRPRRSRRAMLHPGAVGASATTRRCWPEWVRRNKSYVSIASGLCCVKARSSGVASQVKRCETAAGLYVRCLLRSFALPRFRRAAAPVRPTERRVGSHELDVVSLLWGWSGRILRHDDPC
jgi:hypothetical protein